MSRGGQIRTAGLLLPKQARYQAALRPVNYRAAASLPLDCPLTWQRPAVMLTPKPPNCNRNSVHLYIHVVNTRAMQGDCTNANGERLSLNSSI